MTDEDKAYQLTVKGFLAVETGLLGDFNPIWDKLIAFVRKRAADNGMPDGTPRIVLADGGHCMTATKEPEAGEEWKDEQ